MIWSRALKKKCMACVTSHSSQSDPNQFHLRVFPGMFSQDIHITIWDMNKVKHGTMPPPLKDNLNKIKKEKKKFYGVSTKPSSLSRLIMKDHIHDL